MDKPDFRKEAEEAYFVGVCEFRKKKYIPSINILMTKESCLLEAFAQAITKAYLKGRESMREEAAKLVGKIPVNSFPRYGTHAEYYMAKIRSIEIGGENG
jgi:hypothetical protein